jgi:sterol-4alpha-carboxylate 3-dehydrogenase (decarboxylating)
MHGLYQVYQNRQTHFQIGNNTNMFDWTYVTNVAHAHLLAADKLAEPVAPQTDSRPEIVSYPLPSIDVTTGTYRIPTSEARPLGPCLEPPANAKQLVEAFEHPDMVQQHPRPVTRSRFDPLCDAAIARAPTNPLQVAGQAFFITNGEPIYFWDLPRSVWRRLAERDPARANAPERGIIKFSKDIGLILAAGSEWWGWLIGKEPAFTRFRVKFSCVNRWHNIEKARRVLGYEPQVGLEEGVNRMVDVSASVHPRSSVLTIVRRNRSGTSPSTLSNDTLRKSLFGHTDSRLILCLFVSILSPSSWDLMSWHSGVPSSSRIVTSWSAVLH